MNPAEPLIEAFALGPFGTNCYLIHTPPDPEAWIIDASFNPEALIRRAQAAELTPTRVILTHAHIDHIAGLDAVRRAFPGIRVMIHEREAEWLTEPMLNLSRAYGVPFMTKPADDLVRGDHPAPLTLAGQPWRIVTTPGHSPGGITLVHDASGQAIVGDTLFRESIGRSDFPTSDEALLHRSIREKLYTLPPDTLCHPGHGPTTTIGHERERNPYVRP
ncbi:MAG: MBL fold metallo-hydrolase [Phycisphaerales bacterium]|nr:MBL fold metallo-hydrolase [Phycisphaerales bacterium]